MRIVITGASGNVGTALLQRLAGTGGHSLVGLSRRRPPQTPPYDAAAWVTADLGDSRVRPMLREAFRGADAVVHLAWALQPQRQPDRLSRVNRGGTAAVADAVVAAGVPHLLHMSSIGAYAPGRGCTVDESWPVTGVPTSVYSRDKAAAEQIVDRVKAATTVTHVRPALVFQERAASEIARYFLGPLIPRPLIRRGLLRFAPLPDALAFQLVHADDLAAALELLLRDRPGGAFNVAAAPLIDRAAFRETFGGVGPAISPAVLRAAAAATWHARLQPTEPGWLDLALQVPYLDTGRLEALGWAPRRDAREVLGHFVDAMGSGVGHPGPLLHPPRLRPGGTA